MKKMVKILGILLVLLMLALPGNTVFAHEGEEGEPCECEDVTYLQGAERNKEVANILKSVKYKEVKSDLRKEGYKFAGANQVMVVKMPFEGQILTIVAVPFVHENGDVKFAGFTNGEYIAEAPPQGQ